MTWGTLAFLAGLALVDSTSVGTLLIPLWMLLDREVRAPQFLAYLATVAGFYFVLGAVLIAGAGSLRGVLAGAATDDRLSWAQLALGVALFLVSFWFDPKRAARLRARRGHPDPADRWQARLTAARTSYRTTMALGVAAAGIEVLSMLPYLAAVGVITAADVGVAIRLPVLAAYVLVMILPALVLLGVRLAAHAHVEGPLGRLSGWMGRHMNGALGWGLAIIGFLVARDAAVKLDLFGMGVGA